MGYFKRKFYGFVIVLIIAGAMNFYDKFSTWDNRKKNSEIAKVMKNDLKFFRTQVKKDPMISDCKLKHDKKKHGIICFFKIAPLNGEIPASQLSQIRKEMKEELVDTLANSSAKDARSVRRLLSHDIYIGFKYYLSNGKVLASFMIKEKDLR